MTEQEFNNLIAQTIPGSGMGMVDGQDEWYGDMTRIAPLIDLRTQLMSMRDAASQGKPGVNFTDARMDEILRNAAQGGFRSFDGDFAKYATPAEVAGFQGWDQWAQQLNSKNDLMTYAPILGGLALGGYALAPELFGAAGAEAAGAAGGGELAAGAGEFIGGASGGTVAGEGALSGLAGGASGAEVAGAVGGGALSGAGAAAGGGALTQAAGSAMSRILDGTATTADWTQVLGAGASAGLGAAGANAQAGAYSDVADKYLALGAPYRDKLLETYQPGYSIADSPDFMNALDVGAQAAARATSAKSGNPVDNPGAYAEMQKYISGSLALPQLNTTRSQLGTFGQLGTNIAGSNDTAAAGQTSGAYNALGYGLGQITQPQNQYGGALSKLLLNSSQYL